MSRLQYRKHAYSKKCIGQLSTHLDVTQLQTYHPLLPLFFNIPSDSIARTLQFKTRYTIHSVLSVICGVNDDVSDAGDNHAGDCHASDKASDDGDKSCSTHSSGDDEEDEDIHTYVILECMLLDHTKGTKLARPVFFKFAPLLEVTNYLMGQFAEEERSAPITVLPQPNNGDTPVLKKMLEVNNASYLDGLFAYLIGHLREEYDFLHAAVF